LIWFASGMLASIIANTAELRWNVFLNSSSE
jgi:hypothetical protein